MSNVIAKVEQEVLIIQLIGRVDSTNAEAVESDVTRARTSMAHKEVIGDLEQLEYISSAGLRVILRLRKEEPTLKLINASSEVYEILDMTGFTEMIPVSKAYRQLSVQGCEVIGQGANGTVYRVDPDTIVKVYKDQDALPDIQRERELARCAFVLGIPTAIPYDVVKVNGLYGSVFELLNAKSFAQLMRDEPDNLDHYIALYVDLMKKIHGTEVKPEDMPDMRQVALTWARQLQDALPPDKGQKLVDLVAAVPADNHMMHGDYHVKNVMMQNGEVLLIDMDTLCHGNPIFELASVFNAYEGFSEVDHNQTEVFLGLPRETTEHIWRKSLELYLNTDDEARIQEVENKAKLIGYTRLARRLIRRNSHLEGRGKEEFTFYIDHILDLLDKVDSLVF